MATKSKGKRAPKKAPTEGLRALYTDDQLLQREPGAHPFYNHIYRDYMLTTLGLLGRPAFTVEFDGSGDSGTVEEIDFENEALNTLELDYPVIASTYVEKKGWVETASLQRVLFSKAMQEVVYDALEKTDLDWVNNEGGYGQFEIDLTQSPPKLHLDVHIRVTHTNDYGFDYGVK